MFPFRIYNFLRKNKKDSLLLEQLIFFIPLAATSMLVAVTHSLFNAGLARLEFYR